jgi:histone H2B
MPAKAAEKKPSTGGKAPAGKAPATEKKEAGKKTAAAPSGEKKKRGKTRKETYSSYIYKGTTLLTLDLRVKSFKISIAPY